MAKQTMTAVEWIHNKWANEKEWTWEKIESWLEQAKQIEKEHIMMAYNDGRVNVALKQSKKSEQYYNETYNK